jgi:endonuclease V-like protein UPF0215 family
LFKKEARILGLSATAKRKGATLVVGVVFRGSRWLDGILTCALESDKRDHISQISKAIMKSRQYSQLHAVILSQKKIAPGWDIDITDLAQRIKLPVISLVKKDCAGMKKHKKLGANYYHLVINNKPVFVLAKGLGLGMTQELLTIACTPRSSIPEAVRVANLIAEQVTLKWNSLGLA